MKHGTRRFSAGITLAGLVLVLANAAQAASTLWTYNSPTDVKWHQLTDLSTLLVGTDMGIMALDPEKGTPVWERKDLQKVTQYQVEEIKGTPILLVSVNEGGFSNKTKMLGIDITSGQTLWETEKLKGATVGYLPIYQKSMVIVLTARGAGLTKDKPDMMALDMFTGETRWESEFADKVDLQLSDSSGKFFQKYDLSGYEDPVYEGDLAFFTYRGLHCYDLNTGKLVWGVPYDVTEKTYKKANAKAIIDGDVVYTSAKGVIRAHDKATGAVKWTSKDFGGGIAQMELRGKTLYGRMGGQFYEYKDREWKLSKPLGIVALDKATGSPLWQYDKAKDGITNIALLPNQDVVLLADAKSMIGLDSSGNEAFRVPLEFKHHFGGGAKAAKAGMKFMRGGALAFAKHDTSDLDLPVVIEVREWHGGSSRCPARTVFQSADQGNQLVNPIPRPGGFGLETCGHGRPDGSAVWLPCEYGVQHPAGNIGEPAGQQRKKPSHGQLREALQQALHRHQGHQRIRLRPDQHRRG